MATSTRINCMTPSTYAYRWSIRITNPSKFLKHLPCETCGSSDANGLYSDGHTFCFACDATTFPDEQEKQAPVKTSTNVKEPAKTQKDFADRKIARATAEK